MAIINFVLRLYSNPEPRSGPTHPHARPCKNSDHLRSLYVHFDGDFEQVQDSRSGSATEGKAAHQNVNERTHPVWVRISNGSTG